MNKNKKSKISLRLLRKAYEENPSVKHHLNNINDRYFQEGK